MKFHKEGIPSLVIVIVFGLMLHFSTKFISNNNFWIVSLADAISIFLLILILQFFRNPNRNFVIDPNAIIAPADGKVVVIEKVFETEYLKCECLQLSIFMSPINVHINRYPIAGVVTYAKYHPGKFLVAWHPKSSTENERTTIAIKTQKGNEVLFRQIAGALARRIVMYSQIGDNAIQTSEFGFIKFGSRVDLFLPLDSKINVVLNEVVKGGVTKIAEL
jgi:phosphatidylserine decarboxylase